LAEAFSPVVCPRCRTGVPEVWPTMTATILHRALASGFLLSASLALAACWTAPVANVQPKGEPRLIQSGIKVESPKGRSTVQSVDTAARTVSISAIGGGAAITTVPVGPKVKDFDRVKSGDKIKPTLTEELAVYSLRDGKLPGPNGSAETIASSAKVLSVDTSYRLLTVEYPDKETETFKVDREVKLDQMEAGDDVVIRPVQLISLSRWL
jgi:hypothetical protein